MTPGRTKAKDERGRSRGSQPSFQERRQEIIDLAAHLFARNGYAATGVAELCEVTGLGRGGLYHYIGSKEELLVEIHEQVMGPLLERSHRVYELDARPELRLRLVSEVLLASIVERLDHVWVFLDEYRALSGEHLERFRERRREFEAVVQRLIEEGVERGDFATNDIRIATLAFLGLHNFTYQWIRPTGSPGIRELSRAYCDIFFAGISAADGVLSRDDEDELERLRREIGLDGPLEIQPSWRDGDLDTVLAKVRAAVGKSPAEAS